MLEVPVRSPWLGWSHTASDPSPDCCYHPASAFHSHLASALSVLLCACLNGIVTEFSATRPLHPSPQHPTEPCKSQPLWEPRILFSSPWHCCPIWVPPAFSPAGACPWEERQSSAHTFPAFGVCAVVVSGIWSSLLFSAEGQVGANCFVATRGHPSFTFFTLARPHTGKGIITIIAVLHFPFCVSWTSRGSLSRCLCTDCIVKGKFCERPRFPYSESEVCISPTSFNEDWNPGPLLAFTLVCTQSCESPANFSLSAPLPGLDSWV